MDRLFLRILFVALFATLISTPGFGASTENLVLILDGSGSMRGRIQNEAKIDAARRVVRKVVEQLPAGSKLGLVAYGHRQQNDCKDIEILLPPGSGDSSKIPALVDKLNPLGMTPLTAALEQAVVATVKVGKPGTIVLVTDGLETCGGDPCAVVKKAKQAGMDFVLHIVGFDVAKENVLSLECSAQVGGGLYLSAENADQLYSALEKTMTAAAPVGDAKLSVKSVLDGQLHDATVKVFDLSGKEIASGRTYSGSETNPRIIPLVAGSYDVAVQLVGKQGVPETRFSKVELLSGKITEKVADFSTGELSVLVTRNGALSDATINVYPMGSQEAVTGSRSYRAPGSNPKIFHLPTGNYDVKVDSVEITGGAGQLFSNVAVRSGNRTELKQAFMTGTLKIGAVQGTSLVDATTYVLDSNGKSVSGGRTYSDSKTNPKSFELLPGNYTVKVSPVRLQGAAPKVVSVKVTEGTTVLETVQFAP